MRTCAEFDCTFFVDALGQQVFIRTVVLDAGKYRLWHAVSRLLTVCRSGNGESFSRSPRGRERLPKMMVTFFYRPWATRTPRVVFCLFLKIEKSASPTGRSDGAVELCSKYSTPNLTAKGFSFCTTGFFGSRARRTNFEDLSAVMVKATKKATMVKDVVGKVSKTRFGSLRTPERSIPSKRGLALEPVAARLLPRARGRN